MAMQDSIRDSMSPMRILTFLFALSLAACSNSAGASSQPTSPAAAASWRTLFDGQTLAGWQAVQTAPSTFMAKDGMIVCSGIPTGILRTDKMYENFEFEMEWRHMKAGGNAGLFMWSDALTSRGQPFSKSIEVQVMDGVENPGYYTSQGDIFSIHGARMRPARPHPHGWERCLPSESRTKPSPEWNHYRVIANNGELHLEINGKEVSAAYDCTPRKGYICLESEGSECHFRNLRIRELPPSPTPLLANEVAAADQGFRSLYNGVSLAGWRDAAENSAHWQARDWTLVHDGKGGDLWTNEEYGDFELIVDWRLPEAPVEMQRPVIGADGTEQKDAAGKPVTAPVRDAGDSGIFLRGQKDAQVNIWCWPCGSGEVYGYRTAKDTPAEARAAYVPKERADAAPGQWNRFLIRLVGQKLDVTLNGKKVIEGAPLPRVPKSGPIGLQTHGDAVEFANIYIRKLSP